MYLINHVIEDFLEKTEVLRLKGPVDGGMQE